MRLSNAVGRVTLDQQLAFIVESCNPLSTLKRPANGFASAKQNHSALS
jgi:hypothetical protein